MKIKILFIETGSGFGGSSKYLLELLKRLNKNCFEPYVIYAGETSNIEKIKILGIKTQKLTLNIHPTSIPVLSYFHLALLFIVYVLPNVFKIRYSIKKNNIDVVYLNNEIFSHFSSIIAAKTMCKKVVCHNHGLRRLTFLERIFVPWIDRFVCVSQATRDIMIAEVADKPLDVVYNGLDIRDYDLEHIRVDKQVEELGQKGPLIGIFGRIVEWKGHSIFLKAAAMVAERYPDARFVVVGDDFSDGKPFLAKLQSEIVSFGIQKRVIFLGWKENIRETIKGIDIIVHPSIQPEPFGLAIIEAMALEKPLIASRIGAIPEIIEDQITGLLFKAGDSVDLANKIDTLIENDELRSKLAKKARETVAQRFNIGHNVKQIEKIIYEELAKN